MNLLNAIKTRGLLWVTAHVSLILFDKWVEFGLYPRAILAYGVWCGIGVMIVFSMIVCLLLLLFYDWVSTIDTAKIKSPLLKSLVVAASDALGFETLKEIGSEFLVKICTPIAVLPAHTWYGSIKNFVLIVAEWIRKMILVPVTTKAFKPALYLYATFAHDGMTCLILMRPAHCHRMGVREWALFVPSVILSCVSWGLLTGGALAFMRAYTPALYEWVIYLVQIIT